MPTPRRCEFCDGELPAPDGRGGRTGRPARFCSNACRQRSYRRRAKSPAPAAPPPRPPALPAALDPLVGRDVEVANLERILRGSRLVTLLGTGGAGKTRLAYEVAARVGGRYAGGVWSVELASLTSGDLLPQYVAAAIEVREQAGRAMPESIAEALGGGPALLVLDNCEHVVAACADLAAELLRACPGLTILATSREALDVPGELSYRLGELTLPMSSGRAGLLASGAVRLFVERARAVSPGFQLTRDNGPHIAAVCARLDGNPLAIELAARRIRLLPVEEIHDRLDDRFGLLTGGFRTAATRHRDLRAAIEWSFDLLEKAEQAAFRRLSVMAGGFTVDGATAVCAGEGVPAHQVLDLLASLEAKSLVVAEPGGRFRQLESIRLYGRDRLTAAGEKDDAFERLVTWLIDLADPIVGERVHRSYEEIEPLDAEQDNLLHALEWTVECTDDRRILVAAALGRCWRQHGHATEGRRILRDALAATGPAYPGRAAALAHATWLALMQGDQAEAQTLVDEALILEDPATHPLRYVRVVSALASVRAASGDHAAAYESRLRCVELVRPLGQPLDTAVCVQNLAYGAVQVDRYEQAAALMDECIALYREHARQPLPPEWLHTSAMLALANGDTETAEDRLKEALVPGVLTSVGLVMIEGLAVTAQRRGDTVRALRLGGAAAALRRRQSSEPETDLREQFAEAIVAARAQAGAAARGHELAGEQLDADAALAYAASGEWREPGRSDGTGLTRREQTVARLVADGFTNREIAARLRIAERTAESHLEHIRAKLDLRSRAQVAAWAVQHGLSTQH